MKTLGNKGQAGAGGGFVVVLVIGLMLTMIMIIQANFDTAFGGILTASSYATQYGNLTANIGNSLLMGTITPILVTASIVVGYVMLFGRQVS